MSNIFSNFINSFRSAPIIGATETEIQSMIDKYLNFSSIKFDDTLATNISTVYTSCKILADDIGSFPINLYKNDGGGGKIIVKSDDRYSLLHYNPNNYTTSNVFFSSMEYIRNVKGNAFAQINRDNDGKIEGFKILNPDFVTGYSIVNNSIYYLVKPNKDGEEIPISGDDILHFRALTTDGIWGINPIEKLRLNISTTYKALHTVDKFYDNNATSAKALKTVIPDNINPKAWQEKVVDFTEKYGGFKNAGKIISLPPFTELQDLSMNFKDAEFIATAKFNALQIAALYKIPPFMIGEYEHSKFNNLEQTMLSYKISTIRPILRMYRQELEHKLLTTDERINGLSIEFNTNALVETDSKTRIENYKSLFGMGAITPNQIAKYEGFEGYEGGDDHYMLTQLQSVEKLNTKINLEK